MAIQKMVRVDYRLIHGQIVAKWIKSRSIDRIIVADDELVKDEFMSDIYKMAVPNMDVDIVKIEDLDKALDKKNDKVMLIFRNIANAKKAIDIGVGLFELNVGAVESSQDRSLITSGISLSEKEIITLKELKGKGLNVYLQAIPENDPISLDNIKIK